MIEKAVGDAAPKPQMCDASIQTEEPEPQRDVVLADLTNTINSNHTQNNTMNRTKVIQKFFDVDLKSKEENETRVTEGRTGIEDNVYYDLGNGKTVKVGVWKRNDVLLVNILDFKVDYSNGKKVHNCDFTKGTALTVP